MSHGHVEAIAQDKKILVVAATSRSATSASAHRWVAFIARAISCALLLVR